MTDKILLILDLDETLILATQNQLDRPPDAAMWPYHLYLRPFLSPFFQKIQTHFDLAVWSSASDEYVEAMVNTVFPKDIELEFVWGRSHCSLLVDKENAGRYSPDTQARHPLYGKKLKKVHKTFNRPLERILMVDDTSEKWQSNFGNAIYIKKFDGSEEDTELLKLTDFLISLKDSRDVQAIEKRNWQYGEILDPHF